VAKGFNFRNHSPSQDSLEAWLHMLAREGKFEDAARGAIKRQKAKGISITFLRGKEIVTEHSDGRQEVIAVLARHPQWNPRHAATLEPE
jgi:hypothetical protein